MRSLFLLAGVLVLQPTFAGVHADVGFERLQAELGGAVPRGRGLVMMQVESAVPVDHDRNPDTPDIRTWFPKRDAAALKNQTLIDSSDAPAGVWSGHATAVARRLIGTRADQGMATAVSALEVMALSDWLSQGLLGAMSNRLPKATTARVINHSWASTLDPARGGTNNTRVLRRVDWMIANDEIVQVAGIRNALGKTNQALLAASHNAIIVGRSDGHHSHGTPRVDTLYSANRVRPLLVAPLKTSSAATPVVASAVAVLLETAARPSLSTRPDTYTNRAGVRIRDAARPEVMRAVLMASADRSTRNTQYGNIENYRVDEQDRSDNGLDVRYGAGQLNVYKAWQLLSAGETERSRLPGETRQLQGFDYMADFRMTSDPASYRFELTEAGILSATLSWHVLFPGHSGAFDASAVLNNLDLCLYADGPDGETLIGAALSRNETTENLYQPLSPGRYRLAVHYTQPDKPEGQDGQDYALAWQFSTAGSGD